ncbi:peptidoglycan DD-metalloendopeptidase family protein [Desulfotomaculum sp. 1211_IL3151]|uniref:peptidoglycan DD-metalloendopeptidase family protein n=1 Tax=Desulfotomaculum sp. 1211_IL3151 TaxID=3084055 RepID=UPI002FDAAE11
MFFHINKKLAAFTITAILASMAYVVFPASAGLDEVMSEGDYTPPLAQEVEVLKPSEQEPVKKVVSQRVEMEYKVRSGDTLWSIADRTGISLARLAEVNRLDPKDILAEGKTLTIPGVEFRYHKIASGETLSHIAGQYGITLEELLKANDLSNPDLINMGAALVVPNRGEEAQPIVAATSDPGSKVQIGGWAWPVAGEITSNFGIRGDRPHEGVDIGAYSGATIVAPEQGKVVWSGPRGTYGLTIILDHGNGIRSLYAHCSKLLVTEGQFVDRNQPIAKVGNTGRSEGPHLHMETLRQGIPLDPLLFLKERLFA